MYAGNIEEETVENEAYRRVVATTEQQQLVFMHVKAHQTVPRSKVPETHDDTTQFIRVEKGSGLAVIDGKTVVLGPDVAVLVPAKTKHILKASGEGLWLYTLYAPPHHPPEEKKQ